MTEDITLNNIMTFDEQTGLTISSKGEVLEDLKTLTKVAYGTDYVIEQGNEWFSFLDLLAGSIVGISGAAQNLYNTLSYTSASGTNLDNVVSFVGITRKPKQNSSLVIKATLLSTSSVERPYAVEAGKIIVKDYNNVYWVNTETLLIQRFKTTPDSSQEENYVGTAHFEATDENTDPTGAVLAPYNDGHSGTNLEVISLGIPSDISFMNELASILGNQEENDAQLRARYKREIYRDSVGTTEGLIAQISENSNSEYVYIKENNSDSVVDSMPAHSIWTITDGKSTWDGTGTYSTDADDIAIAQAIFDYKSLGCGTSTSDDTVYDSVNGEGPIHVSITSGTTEYDIAFSRARRLKIYAKLEMVTNLVDGEERQSLEYSIKQSIISYVTNLGISNDVLYSGLSSAVYSVIESNNEDDFIADIDNLYINTSINPSSGKRVAIDINEYAYIETDNTDSPSTDGIIITWTVE